jgi:hypothetical protein
VKQRSGASSASSSSHFSHKSVTIRVLTRTLVCTGRPNYDDAMKSGASGEMARRRAHHLRQQKQ